MVFLMALDVSKSSMFQDIFGMGANLGTYYALKKEHYFNDEKIKEIISEKNPKQEILQNLIRFLFKSIITELIKNIPLPKQFTREKLKDFMVEQTIKEIKKESPKQNLNKNTLVRLLKLYFQIPQNIATEDSKLIQKTVPNLLEKFKKLFKELMEENIQATKNTRKSIQKLFLQSDYPSPFVISTSKMCNVLITYYHYVITETEKFLDESIQVIQRGDNLGDYEWKQFFMVDMEKVLKLQFKLFKLFIELLLFIEIWNAPSFDSLFKPLEKETLVYKKLENKFFKKQVQKIDMLADKMHMILLDTMYQQKTDIPYTLEKDPEITEKEKLLLSKLLFV